MMLADPNATPLDLRFRLFGTPVRVHPLFWLVTALLGWPDGRHGHLANGLGDVLVFVACAFVSILLHEFGHVWMAQVFGGRGQHIVLHSMGGLAYNATAPRRWQRILVLAAGPGIQLVLYAALVGLGRLGVWRNLIGTQIDEEPAVWQIVLFVALNNLFWINLAWAILNLLPIWPLDGGQITREVATGVSPYQGLTISLWISLIVSGVLAVNALMAAFLNRPLIPPIAGYPVGLWLSGGMWMALFFVMFAVGSLQALMAQRSQERQRHYWEDDDSDLPPWRR